MTRIRKTALVSLISMFPQIFAVAPVAFFLFALFSLLHAFFWYVVIEVNERFYNSLVFLGNGEGVAYLGIVLKMLLLSLCVNMIKQVVNGISNYIPIIIKSKINQRLTYDLHKKLGKVEAVLFENEDFLNKLEKANRGKSEISWNIITLFYVMFFYIPYLALVSHFLFVHRPILALMIVIIFIPIGITQLVKIKIFAKAEDLSAPIQRENDYYKACVVEREYFKETRMLGAVGFFVKLFCGTLKSINDIKIKANKKNAIINLGLRLLSLLGYLAVLLLLFESVLLGYISIGAFAAVFEGVNDVYKLMEELVYSQVGGMIRDLGYIKNYTSFMETNDSEMTRYIDEFRKIEVSNISFRYPGATDYAIKDVNFNMEKGEIIAIVGANGSGKTTLTKLLAGIYKPEKGNIIYNDVEGKLDLEKVSAVFQNFQKYMLTLQYNISMSDLNSVVAYDRLEEVCAETRIPKDNIDIFPDGYDTMLAREFDGIELSGGQWQRIAIARGLYKKGEFIILDEPTSAIDPLEEQKIYNDFVKLIKGKTSIIVTHRLGSIHLADRIIVLDKGRVVGEGSHDYLIEKCELYKEMYNEQKKWYV